MRTYLACVIAILMDHYKIEPIGVMAWVGLSLGAFLAAWNDWNESKQK